MTRRDSVQARFTPNGSEEPFDTKMERWLEMVTGRDLEVMKYRREELIREAAAHRLAAAAGCVAARPHLLAVLGASLVRIGLAMQSHFSAGEDPIRGSILPIENRPVAVGSEGC